MKLVKEKRPKVIKGSSIFDPIIDEFIKSEHELVEIAVEDRTPSSMVTQLKKRFERREIEDIEASHAAGFVYLEKKKE